MKIVCLFLGGDSIALFFYKNQQNWTLGLLFLKFSSYLRYIVLNLFLFFLNFLKNFHNTVMICNARNRSNDARESQKEKKPVLMLIFSTVSQKTRD